MAAKDAKQLATQYRYEAEALLRVAEILDPKRKPGRPKGLRNRPKPSGISPAS
jgi:hypothetical protein